MEFSKNEKGMTLVEVLVSIVILSMILLTTMSFFPQMGLLNKQNTVKSQGINTAKEILLKWENDAQANGRLDKFFTNQSSTVISDYTGMIGDNYNFETTDGEFFENIQIKKNPTLQSKLYNTHLIIVNLYKANSRNILISKTYGYVQEIRR